MNPVENDSQSVSPAPIVGRGRVLKRILQVGFLLFLLKGLAWLALAWLSLGRWQ